MGWGMAPAFFVRGRECAVALVPNRDAVSLPAVPGEALPASFWAESAWESSWTLKQNQPQQLCQEKVACEPMLPILTGVSLSKRADVFRASRGLVSSIRLIIAPDPAPLAPTSLWQMAEGWHRSPMLLPRIDEWQR